MSNFGKGFLKSGYCNVNYLRVNKRTENRPHVIEDLIEGNSSDYNSQDCQTLCVATAVLREAFLDSKAVPSFEASNSYFRIKTGICSFLVSII